MAKKSSKTRTSKIKKLTQNNIFTSVAIASILCNVLLLSIVYVGMQRDTISYDLFRKAQTDFCTNPNSLSNMVNNAIEDGRNPDNARQNYNIACQTDGFAKYYQQAVKSYQQVKQAK